MASGEVVVRKSKGRRDRIAPLSSSAGDALAAHQLLTNKRGREPATDSDLCHASPKFGTLSVTSQRRSGFSLFSDDSAANQ